MAIKRELELKTILSISFKIITKDFMDKIVITKMKNAMPSLQLEYIR